MTFGTGNPFTEDFRLLRGIPATLNGSAGAGAAAVAANNALVEASTRDPWIQAVNNGAPAISVPAFVRAAAVVSFDFYLCSGNGSPVPNDIVEISIFDGMSPAVPSTGNVLSDVVTTGSAGEVGRSILLQATAAGRVTGTYTQAAAVAAVTAVVRYRGIPVTVLPALAPTP